MGQQEWGGGAAAVTLTCEFSLNILRSHILLILLTREIHNKHFYIAAGHWPCLNKMSGTEAYSLIKAQQREREEVDTVTAFASLSVVQDGSPR